jgi:hypothetical protein
MGAGFDITGPWTIGGLIDEKNFHGGLSLPQNFQTAFYMQIEKSNKFGQVKDNRKNSKTDIYQIEVKESNGDFTSGLTRPLAAEIVFLPFSAITKALITSKRYKIDGKCPQNTNRKPWSPYRLVTSLPVSNAP